MALSNSKLAAMLGVDPTFIGRCATVMCDQATKVLAEQGVGDTHTARAFYANRVIANPSQMATQAGPFLAQSTNVANTIALEDNGITTTVTDAALLAQIGTSWNTLAGVDTGN